MPAGSHPKDPIVPTRPRRRSIMKLQASGDRGDSSKSPADVKRQKDKEVHWDSTAIDNKPRVKPSRISPTKAKGLLIPGIPSQTPITPKANTPAKLSRSTGTLPIDSRRHNPSSSTSSSTHRNTIPPPVPSAPKTLRPPPTPRPTRLPSPDLPPIDGSRMFPPLPSGKSYPNYPGTKIDSQMKAALAYMQARRRG